MLIEILDALFAELEGQLSGWFGKKKRSRDLISSIRKQLKDKKAKAGSQDLEVHEAQASEKKNASKAKADIGHAGLSVGMESGFDERWKNETSLKYSTNLISIFVLTTFTFLSRVVKISIYMRLSRS